jgi:photosystem II stability/assembly factor-like uncharacterized protein
MVNKTRTDTAGTAKPSARNRQRAVPPLDDPLQRHEELDVDRKVGIEDAQFAAVSTAIAPDTDSIERRLARLRLAALAQSRRMLESADDAGVAPVPGTSNWVQMGPTAIPKGQTYSSARVFVTGRVTAIVIDPTDHDIIYVGTAQGGVWKTVNGGAHWRPTTDNEISLAIGALAMDPSNHLVLYAGTGEGNFSLDSYYGNGVLKTSDGGNSWITQGAADFIGTRFGRIAVTPGTPARVLAATGFGTYRSIDSGTTWVHLTNGLPTSSATDVVIDPTTPTTAYAAFWAGGIYKTTNADAANPVWTQLTSGLPSATAAAPNGFTRIALAISLSNPQTLYALMANNDTANPNRSLRYLVDKFFISTNGGSTWSSIPLPSGNIGAQGFYNLNVAVDPTTPNIVYLSGISLWKATRNPVTNIWTITDIGGPFHPDNHALAFDPVDHLVLYAGSDGGIYRSSDGGTTWSDTLNAGLCVTQFEFMDQHPTSDAMVIGGTQDNGTEQFRNSPVFYHSDDGDGGFVAIDANQPRNILSTYYGPSPKRSTQAGRFGSWIDVSSGIAGNALFYPPFTLDQTNPNNIAFGTNQINLDPSQGTSGWPSKVTLPGVSGRVSAIAYVTSNLIYAGTEAGQVYRVVQSGITWTATAVNTAPLPARFIWDIATRPGDVNTIVVVMSGFGTAHVWRGTVATTGTTTWTDISGTGAGRLPDIPVNALAIEPTAPDTIYIATDIAVYRTIDGGTTWTQFSQGLPNCAVFDMRLHSSQRLLRAATHGRGMWERQLDVASLPDIDLFVRDNSMDTGRFVPSSSGVPAAFDDALQHIALGDPVWWWQCVDIKIDALEGAPPAYQMSVADVNYVAFESKLEHRNPQRGQVNRVYVQVHNRGIQPATDVTVKILYANASAGLPNLPSDFWTAFPGNSSSTLLWTPIGAAQVIPSLPPDEPTILEWEWSTPMSAADHSCILVVIDSPTNPIPAMNKVFDVNTLVNSEKRVGLKNLHVVNAVPGTFYWTPFQLFGSTELRHNLRFSRLTAAQWGIGFLLERDVPQDLEFKGISRSQPTSEMLRALEQRLGTDLERFDTTTLFTVEGIRRGGTIVGLALPSNGLQIMILLVPPSANVRPGTLSIVQEVDQRIVGGSTFFLRTIRQ